MDNCPKCNTSFIGEPIPEEYIRRGLYGDATHWRREIGIDGGRIDIYDGIVANMCPDCGHEFPRDNSDWAKRLFKMYKEK